MKITRENYEAYVVDYLDGRLPAEAQAALLLFLAEYPELEVDLDLPLLDDFAPLTSASADFSALKLGGSAPTRELWLAAIAEGDELGALAEAAAQHPIHVQAIASLKKLRLTADTSVVYPDKSALRRPVVLPLFPLLARYAAAAAAIALLLGGAYFFNSPSGVPARLALTPGTQLEVPLRAGDAETDVMQENAAENAAAQLVEPAIDVPVTPLESGPIERTPSTLTARDHIAVERTTIRPAGRTPASLEQRTLAQIDWTAPAVLSTETPVAGSEGLANREDAPEALPVSPTRPLTVTEFFTQRAQERITGRKPEDGQFLEVLADRTLERVNEWSNGQVAVARADEAESRKFKLKLGPITIQR